jgi:AraC-like DNA-binding protein
LVSLSIPAGTLPFLPHSASLFTNRETSLEDLWGSSMRSLRDRLREARTPERKLGRLETFFLTRLHRTNAIRHNPIVRFSLGQIHAAPKIATVADLSRTTGLSPRRLSQLFREQIGVAPKVYCRIQRFHQAIQQLHAGVDLPWSELALGCGYYDQSHFANDFRAFSGLSPTIYTAATRPWSNHINLD